MNKLNEKVVKLTPDKIKKNYTIKEIKEANGSNEHGLVSYDAQELADNFATIGDDNTPIIYDIEAYTKTNQNIYIYDGRRFHNLKEIQQSRATQKLDIESYTYSKDNYFTIYDVKYVDNNKSEVIDIIINNLQEMLLRISEDVYEELDLIQYIKFMDEVREHPTFYVVDLINRQYNNKPERKQLTNQGISHLSQIEQIIKFNEQFTSHLLELIYTK